jgi:arsenate reductase
MPKNILFICNENSARSQMAEGFFNHYNKNKNYIGKSAGIDILDKVKNLAIKVMKEKDIDISNQKPKKLTSKMIDNSELIITMGCIKGCPLTPKKKTIDWNLNDPKTLEDFRNIRDKIEEKVKRLIKEIEVKNL